MTNNENKTTQGVEAHEDNREVIFVPKGYANDEPNLVIGINGVNYVLPKGKNSTVPDFVAAEFHRSQRAAEKRDENIEKMLEAASK